MPLSSAKDLSSKPDLLVLQSLTPLWPTQKALSMLESYTTIEFWISDACLKFSEMDKPNIAMVAQEFQVLETRLRGRQKGRQSKSEHRPSNKLLTKAEELSVCMYLDKLEVIGTAARISMVIQCVNSVVK